MGIELIKKSGQIVLQKEMLRGDDGGYYTPSVDEDGNLTWIPSLEDMPEVEGANIKGDKGDTGETGSVEWGDLTEEQIAALKGDKGDDGYTPVKGVDYFDGEDGYTPVKGVDYFDGVDGKDGYTPVKGVDYFDGEDGKDGAAGAKGADALTTRERVYTSDMITGTNDMYFFKSIFFSRTPKANDIFTAFLVDDEVTPAITYLTNFKVYSQYDDREWKCQQVGYNNRVTGTTGATGAAGADGEDGITPHIGDNGNWFIGETDTGVAAQGETGATGATGATGEAGADGVSPTVEITAIDGGNRVSITDADGSTSFDVMNGSDGAAGADGADGYTPVRGTDYWTEEDKAEIVAATVAALPVYGGEVEAV